jgi:hypothetical protein
LGSAGRARLGTGNGGRAHVDADNRPRDSLQSERLVTLAAADFERRLDRSDVFLALFVSRAGWERPSGLEPATGIVSRSTLCALDETWLCGRGFVLS